MLLAWAAFAAEQTQAAKDVAEATRQVRQGVQNLDRDLAAGTGHLQKLADQIGEIRKQQDEARRRAGDAAKAANRAWAAAMRCDEAGFTRLAAQARRSMKQAQDLRDAAGERLGELEQAVQKAADAVSDHLKGLHDAVSQGFEAAERAGLKDTSVAASNLRRAQEALAREMARQASGGTEAKGYQDAGSLSRFNKALDEFADAIRKTSAGMDLPGDPGSIEELLERAARYLTENCPKKVARTDQVAVALDTTPHTVLQLGPMTEAELLSFLAAQGIVDYAVTRIPEDDGGGWLVSYRTPGALTEVGPDREHDRCRVYLPEGKGAVGHAPSLQSLQQAAREARAALDQAHRELMELSGPDVPLSTEAEIERALAEAKVRDAQARATRAEEARRAAETRSRTSAGAATDIHQQHETPFRPSESSPRPADLRRLQAQVSQKPRAFARHETRTDLEMVARGGEAEVLEAGTGRHEVAARAPGATAPRRGAVEASRQAGEGSEGPRGPPGAAGGAPDPGGLGGTVTDAQGNPAAATVLLQEPTPTPEDLVEGKSVPWTERDTAGPTVVSAGPDGRFQIPPAVLPVLPGLSLIVSLEWEQVSIPLEPEKPPVVAKGPRTPRPPRDPKGPTVAEGDPPPPPPDENGTPPPPEDPPPPPPEDPPPPPDEELKRQKPCCRLIGKNVYYPITREWLKAPPMQEAFNEPAVAADRVFLHDLSVFDNALALFVKSVGYPFEFTHHYRSNVTTVKGGILGHKRDFSYNARIVPEATRTTADGLFVEQLGLERVPILYANGRGRVDRYEVLETDLEPRLVRNFGVSLFRAYVTTYTSPPGAFHEIQRYVLLDGEPHPFERHPNVEKVGGASERVFYVLRDKYGFRYIFNCRGQLIYVADRNENLTTLIYDTKRPPNPLTQNRVLKTIIDTNGRSYELEYENKGQDLLFTNVLCELVQGSALIPRLKSVTDFDGRKVVFRHTGSDNNPVLESVSWEPFGPGDRERGITFETRYQHTPDFLLRAVTAPREVVSGGPPYLTFTWNGTRVGRIRLGGTLDGRQAGGEFEVTPLGSAVLVKDRVGNQRRYDLARVSESMVVAKITLTGARGEDRGPWTTEFLKHNEDYQVGEIVLPKKNRVRFAYDPANEIVIQGAVRNKVGAYTYKNNLSKGNLLSMTRVSDRPGEADLETTFEYEPLFNQVTAVIDPRKTVTSYHYSGGFPSSFFDRVSGNNGNVRLVRYPTVTRPDGAALRMTVENIYDPRNGLLRRVKDSGDHATTYTYESGPKDGYLKTILYSNGASASFETDSRGNVTRAIDMGGTITRFDVNKRDLMIRKIEDEKGFANATDYFHDRNGNVEKVVVDRKDNFDDAAARALGLASRVRTRVTRTTKYDLLNRPIEVVEDAEGPGAAKRATRFFYDRNGNLESVDSPSPAFEGTVAASARYTYDGRDLVESVTRKATPGPDTIVRHAYDANGNLEVATDPRCGATMPAAVRTSSPTPQCPFTRYVYDQFDRLKETVNPVGAVHANDRIDPNGNVEEVTVTGPTGDAAGRRGLLSRTTYQYDQLNRLVERKQHVLRVLAAGQVREDRDAAVITQWLYNRDGLVEKIVGPGRGETRFAYDALHRQELVTDAEGNETKYEYDSAGNLEVVRESDLEPRVQPPIPMPGEFDGGKREFVTKWAYDALRRPVARTDTGGHVRRLLYDSLGSVLGQIDEDGRPMVMAYDNLGRLVERTRERRRTTYEYYPAGTLKRVRTPIVERSWEYDLLGQILVAREEKAVTRIERDPAGNPRTLTDANGTVMTAEFNGLNRPTSVRAVLGTALTCAAPEGGAAPAITHLEGPLAETFRYDGLGRLVHASNGRGAVDRVYDGLGRLLTDAQSFRPLGGKVYDTHVVSTAHDATLERLETRYPAIAGGSSVVTLLDRLGRVAGLELDRGFLAAYRYAGKDRLAWRQASDVETFRQYDEDRRNWRVTVAQSGTTLARWVTAYDVHTPVRVAEEIRTDTGKRFRIIETTLDRERRPIVTRTYGYTRLDKPPSPRALEGLRERLTGVKAGDLAQIEIMLTETLRQYDPLGRAARMVEVSFDEVNEAFSTVRTDAFTYDNHGRTSSTTTRLIQDVKQGPGAAAQLVSSALTNVKAVVLGFKAMGPDDIPLAVISPAGAALTRGLRQAVSEGEPSRPAFTESQVFGTSVDGAFNLADSLVASPALPPETQTFRYDCNGNLFEDGRYRYSYDHHNRVTHIRDTLPRRGNAFYSVKLYYDPLGRRVFQEYDPNAPGDALADLRLLYDDRRLIAEVAVDRGQGTLLARYFHGAGEGELLRMDRRPDEQPDSALALHYLHDGHQEEPIFASADVAGTRARPITKENVGVVRDDRVIETTTTRLPYSARHTRREPLSGLACDESAGTCLFDFRSAPKTEDFLQQQARRKRLLAQTAALHREVLTVLAVEVAPAVALEMGALAVGQSIWQWGATVGQSALGWGAFGLGVDYGIAKVMGHDYTIEQGLGAFGLGALSAGFGASMSATFGATSTMGQVAGRIGFAVDVAAGTATDMLFSGSSFQDALVSNLAVNAGGMGLSRLVHGTFARSVRGAEIARVTANQAPATRPASQSGRAGFARTRVGEPPQRAVPSEPSTATPAERQRSAEWRVHHLGRFEVPEEGVPRSVVVVETPLGPRAFYTRSGTGGVTAGGAQAGHWAPFEGFALTPGAFEYKGKGHIVPVGTPWMVKHRFIVGIAEAHPLYRFGTRENLEISRWLGGQRFPTEGPSRTWREIQADLEALGVPTIDPVSFHGGVRFQ